MRLFHFSDDGDIARFVPRPVHVAAERPPGRDWLNGPLVWATDEARQPLYFFPRDCPRILLYPTPETTPQDLELWWGSRTCRMIAHIEWAWFERFRSGRLFRYELPTAAFEDLNDTGMWVARTAVEPIGVVAIDNLPAALAEQGVELRLMQSLVPLRGVWETSLHASGIRLRNAAGWNV
jgi:hypothetical protein